MFAPPSSWILRGLWCCVSWPPFCSTASSPSSSSSSTGQVGWYRGRGWCGPLSPLPAARTLLDTSFSLRSVWGRHADGDSGQCFTQPQSPNLPCVSLWRFFLSFVMSIVFFCDVPSSLPQYGSRRNSFSSKFLLWSHSLKQAEKQKKPEYLSVRFVQNSSQEHYQGSIKRNKMHCLNSYICLCMYVCVCVCLWEWRIFTLILVVLLDKNSEVTMLITFWRGHECPNQFSRQMAFQSGVVDQPADFTIPWAVSMAIKYQLLHIKQLNSL